MAADHVTEQVRLAVERLTALKNECGVAVLRSREVRWPAADDFADDLRAVLTAFAAREASVRVLREALGKMEREDLRGAENELGEDYITCDRCDRQDWGSLDVYDAGSMDHSADCPFAALSETPGLAALRELLREVASTAYIAGACEHGTRANITIDSAKAQPLIEAIVGRVLGEGGGK